MTLNELIIKDTNRAYTKDGDRTILVIGVTVEGEVDSIPNVISLFLRVLLEDCDTYEIDFDKVLAHVRQYKHTDDLIRKVTKVEDV